MSKSGSVLAFEAALTENKELKAKYDAALKRIIENREAANDGEALVKASAEAGFTLTMPELERSMAQKQELSDEDLARVAGAGDSADTSCLADYSRNDANGNEWNIQLPNNTPPIKFG